MSGPRSSFSLSMTDSQAEVKAKIGIAESTSTAQPTASKPIRNAAVSPLRHRPLSTASPISRTLSQGRTPK